VCDDHEIVPAARATPGAPEALAQQALGAVPGDGSADSAPDGQAQAMVAHLVRGIDDQEQLP
jgi:hypothetical protein